MKAPALLLVCLFLAPLAEAQFTKGDAIKATTTVHGDGSRSTLVVNPETQSAEETFFNLAGKVTQKITYPLDERNQPIGAITYDAKGTIVAKSSYKRDAEGRIAEETITSPAGQVLRRRVYSYRFDPQSKSFKISGMDEYDPNGNLIAKPQGAKPGKKR